MIIAGPNLTIDRTSRLAALRPGEVLRLSDVAVTPGGKGLNVARAALILRAPASLVGFIPGYTGRAAAAMIAEEGVTLQGVPVPGDREPPGADDRHRRDGQQEAGPDGGSAVGMKGQR